jgi:hypothetical protein
MPRYHIHEVKMQNLMRISEAQYTFGANDSLVIVGGDNEQGKSSFLDVLAWLFTKGKKLSEMPVHEGHTKGSASVQLCDDDGKPCYTIKKTVRANGTAEVLVIDQESGEGFTSLPEFITDMTAKGFGFDPLQFARDGKTPDGRRRQLDTLKRLVGLDFSKQDETRKALEISRTETGREKKFAEENLMAIPKRSDLPDMPVVIADVQDQLRLAQSHNYQHGQLASEVTRLNAEYQRADNTVTQARAALERAEMESNAIHRLYAQAVIAHDNHPDIIDTAPIEEQIRTASETNQAIVEQQRRAQLAAALATAQNAWDEQTEKIQAIDAAKAEALQSAKMPVNDLSFDEDGITYQGRPFSVASSAGQLRVSMAMGIALNPQLKLVILYDGNDLDAKNLKLVADMAEEAGMLVLMEKVGKEGCTFVLDNGKLIAPAASQQTLL